MSEITIMGCDGCQKAATARRPVTKVRVFLGEEGEVGLTFDAHDFECIRRYFSRITKDAKEVAKAERAQAGDSPRKGTARK